MKSKNISLIISMFLLASCNSVDTSKQSNTSNISTSDITNNSTSSSIEVFSCINQESIRFSSIYDIQSSTGTTTYKMEVPNDNKYIISANPSIKIKLFDADKKQINTTSNSFSVNLNKKDIVYMSVESTADKAFTVNVKTSNINSLLPYDVVSDIDYKNININDYASLKNEPAEISYTKRNDGKGLYINSNNPEKLSEDDMNKVLTRQKVSNKDVFFTFEHNNPSKPFYYGYRVTNIDDKDVFITVKNLGFQLDGAGCWLGEDEWIKFYNVKFNSDTSNFSSSQKANYNAYVGFSNNYTSENRQPITYRIPKGQYIYVMGGTTIDAYENINVFQSANKTVSGGCSNGAVLFSVSGGQAEGSFMVYTDNNASKINNSEYVKSSLQNGYDASSRDGKPLGYQYIGYDDCHGVVDSDLKFVFDDDMSSGAFPVTYTNPYFTTALKGEPYKQITVLAPKKYTNSNYWTTHINPAHTQNAVGTDMTLYKTIDKVSKQEITIGPSFYDGCGNTANIGNWMVDYIDTFTLINLGNNERTFKYKLTHSGVILAFVRDENGNISNTYKPAYLTNIAASSYGDAISQFFEYEIKVKPNSTVRFSVNYNLLANAYGNINHYATIV